MAFCKFMYSTKRDYKVTYKDKRFILNSQIKISALYPKKKIYEKN